MADAYALLNISGSASSNDIKSAYKKDALKNHPDRHPFGSKDEATEKFKKIGEAYAILSDPIRKRQYDLSLNGGSSALRSSTPQPRQRRSSFSGRQTADPPANPNPPPPMSTFAGIYDPYRLFEQAWGNRAADEIFASELGGEFARRQAQRNNDANRRSAYNNRAPTTGRRPPSPSIIMSPPSRTSATPARPSTAIQPSRRSSSTTPRGQPLVSYNTFYHDLPHHPRPPTGCRPPSPSTLSPPSRTFANTARPSIAFPSGSSSSATSRGEPLGSERRFYRDDPLCRPLSTSPLPLPSSNLSTPARPHLPGATEDPTIGSCKTAVGTDLPPPSRTSASPARSSTAFLSSPSSSTTPHRDEPMVSERKVYCDALGAFEDLPTGSRKTTVGTVFEPDKSWYSERTHQGLTIDGGNGNDRFQASMVYIRVICWSWASAVTIGVVYIIVAAYV